MTIFFCTSKCSKEVTRAVEIFNVIKAFMLLCTVTHLDHTSIKHANIRVFHFLPNTSPAKTFFKRLQKHLI